MNCDEYRAIVASDSEVDYDTARLMVEHQEICEECSNMSVSEANAKMVEGEV
jgi:hypothetical protein